MFAPRRKGRFEDEPNKCKNLLFLSHIIKEESLQNESM